MFIYKTIKARGPKTAFIVTMLTFPLGMFYLNRWRWALIYTSLYISIFYASKILLPNNSDYNDVIGFTLIAFMLMGAFHAYHIAKKTDFKHLKLSWYARIFPPVIFGLIAVMLFISFIIRPFIFEPFNIPAQSMRPTLNAGDYIFSSKSAYGHSKYALPANLPLWDGKILKKPPQRGDIIIFDLAKNPKISYIKRVIGLPNDTIQMLRGRLFINGVLVKQTKTSSFTLEEHGEDATYTQYTEQLPNGKTYEILSKSDHEPLDNTDVYTVPNEHYFVLGDNRDNSLDSRVISQVSMVHEDYIIGKASIRYYNVQKNKFTFEKI